MRDYLVIYQRGKAGGWGAYAPDLPRLGVAADTREEAGTLIRDGIKIYMDALLEDGLPVPEPVIQADWIAVPA